MKSSGVFLSKLFLGSVFSIVILASCGNDTTTSPGPIAEKRAFVGNVGLEDSGLDPEHNCAQITQGDNTKYLEISAGPCRGGLQATYQKRLTAFEPASTDATSGTAFYLFDQYLLVGELTTKDNEIVLAELCSGDFYSGNCELNAVDGRFAGLSATPSGEIANKQALSENQSLRRLVALLTQGLNDRVKDLLKSNNIVAAQKSALLGVLAKVKSDLAKLRATIAIQLNGDKGNNGLLSQLEPLRLKVGELQSAIQARGEGLKSVDQPVTQAQQALDESTQALNSKKTERALVMADLKKALEEVDKKMLQAKLDALTSELGRIYTDNVDKVSALQDVIAARNQSDLVKADASDRALLVDTQAKFTGVFKTIDGFRAVQAKLDGLAPDLDTAIKYVGVDNYSAGLSFLSSIAIKWESAVKSLPK